MINSNNWPSLTIGNSPIILLLVLLFNGCIATKNHEVGQIKTLMGEMLIGL
jgi:hypothetical protein